MIKRILSITALAIVFTFTLGSKDCNKKQQQDFRTGVAIGAEAGRGVDAEVGSYCRAGFIKPESCERIKPHTEKLSMLADRGDKFVKDHPKLDLESKKEILALIDDVIKELDAMELDGTIEFKDPDKRRNFLLGLAIARSSVRAGRIWIEQAPVEPEPSPSPSPSPSSRHHGH